MSVFKFILIICGYGIYSKTVINCVPTPSDDTNCTSNQRCQANDVCVWNCLGPKTCEAFNFECELNTTCIIHCGVYNGDNPMIMSRACMNAFIRAESANNVYINGMIINNAIPVVLYNDLSHINVYCPINRYANCTMNYRNSENINGLKIYSVYGFINTKIYGHHFPYPTWSSIYCGSNPNQMYNNNCLLTKYQNGYWECYDDRIIGNNDDDSCINPNVLTKNPTISPSISPLNIPTISPSKNPSNNPTNNPNSIPTYKPSAIPTKTQSTNPTLIPSESPTLSPTNNPSLNPSILNTTKSPTTINSTLTPTFKPSNQASTSNNKNAIIWTISSLVIIFIIGFICFIFVSYKYKRRRGFSDYLPLIKSIESRQEVDV